MLPSDFQTPPSYFPTLLSSSHLIFQVAPSFDTLIPSPSTTHFTLYSRIDHFTVSCLVAWPLNESEAGGDLALIKKPPCFSHVNDAVLMLMSRNFHMKSSEVSIKTRSTPSSLSFKGQATKHTTVKWSIPCCSCSIKWAKCPFTNGSHI